MIRFLLPVVILAVSISISILFALGSVALLRAIYKKKALTD